MFVPGSFLFKLTSFWITSKQIFCAIKINFYWNPIPKTIDFTFMEKNLKKSFFSFQKCILFIESP